jgi:hypothetical protein
MIIHQPEIINKDGKVIVSARIELNQAVPQFPQFLWFSFPEEYETCVSNRSDGFVTGVLRMAMYFNESLEVRGSVSPLLAYNLEECQRIYHRWLPDTLNLIDVNYQDLRAPSLEQEKGAVGLSFSGGVDSTFSLLKHLPQNQTIPQIRVTHLLFNQGFNRADFDEASYQAALEKFQSLAKRLNLEVISANTNVRDLSEPWVEWRVVCHSSLIGTPLILSNLFSVFIVSANYSYAEIYKPFSNSSLVDQLFSTETMKFIHHGATYNRMQKVAVIGPWEEAQKHLRVCLNHEGNYGVYNCSYCEKCVITMIMLKISGYLEKFRTFRQPFKYWDILRLGPQYNARYPMRWVTPYIIEKKKYHFLIPVSMGYFIGWFKNILVKLFPDFIKQPLKKLIYPERNKTLSRDTGLKNDYPPT